jgi:hypothetical protein
MFYTSPKTPHLAVLCPGLLNLSGSFVPKVANNCSTKNGGFGAIVAVSKTHDDFRLVP